MPFLLIFHIFTQFFDTYAITDIKTFYSGNGITTCYMTISQKNLIFTIILPYFYCETFLFHFQYFHNILNSVMIEKYIMNPWKDYSERNVIKKIIRFITWPKSGLSETRIFILVIIQNNCFSRNNIIYDDMIYWNSDLYEFFHIFLFNYIFIPPSIWYREISQ